MIKGGSNFNPNTLKFQLYTILKNNTIIITVIFPFILFTSIIFLFVNAYNKRKLYTKPIKPDTSTSEKPMNAHRTKLLLIEGLRQIDNTKDENIRPTPIPTPANMIKGILDAKYRKPRRIINTEDKSYIEDKE
jgi:hypothetical protein